MIPNKILLPSLSPKDQAEFNKLCTDYDKSYAQIVAYGRDAYVARKKELRAELASAPGDKLLSIGAEMESLENSFMQARRGAKVQLRALGGRYVALFKGLLIASDKHADELLSRVSAEWAKHFASFEAVPSGTSPLVQFIQSWKQSILQKRRLLEAIASGMTPPPPMAILPYPTKR
jgi:hypothetical protein